MDALGRAALLHLQPTLHQFRGPPVQFVRALLDVGEHVGWGVPVQGFPWTRIQLGGHRETGGGVPCRLTRSRSRERCAGPAGRAPGDHTQAAFTRRPHDAVESADAGSERRALPTLVRCVC